MTIYYNYLTVLVHVVEDRTVFSSKEALHLLLKVILNACVCSRGARPARGRDEGGLGGQGA